MNTFGTLFKISIYGESHGEAVGVIVDGCPPGITISPEEMESDLSRRRGGGKGATPRKEADLPVFLSGVFEGKTTGSPVHILFENRNVDSKSYEELKDTPRPGHADMVANQKFAGLNDYWGGGHFSGRLTAGLVAAGCIAKKIIHPMSVKAEIIEIGKIGESGDIEAKIDKALKNGDSVGGVVECRVESVQPGLGEPFFESVESLIGSAVFSIPGIKGIEFGMGFAGCRMTGSQFNDEILDTSGRTLTNNSGGINGGITNGNDILFRAAVRPTASIPSKQKTVNLKTGEQVEIAVTGRHDTCIALRMPVIIEAVTAIVMADLKLRQNAYS
jgi:chorismate synthase